MRRLECYAQVAVAVVDAHTLHKAEFLGTDYYTKAHKPTAL